MLNEYIKFPHVKQILKVNRIRMDLKGNNRTEETAYYITSLSEEKADAKELLKLVRGHWSIESLHWIRDRVFDEDRSQTRKRFCSKSFCHIT
jgi:predicted transposase YbfD/YdcC